MPGPGFAESTFSRAVRTNLACPNQRRGEPQSGVLSFSKVLLHCFLVWWPQWELPGHLTGPLAGFVHLSNAKLSKAGCCQNVSKGLVLFSCHCSWKVIRKMTFQGECQGRGLALAMPPRHPEACRVIGFSLYSLRALYICLCFYFIQCKKHPWRLGTKLTIAFTSMSFFWLIQ